MASSRSPYRPWYAPYVNGCVRVLTYGLLALSHVFFSSIDLFLCMIFAVSDYLWPPKAAETSFEVQQDSKLYVHEQWPSQLTESIRAEPGLLSEDPDENLTDPSPIVFFHGYLSSGRFWEHVVIPQLPDHVSRRFRIVAPDLLGFGRSPCPDHILFTMEHHIQSLEHSLIEERNLNQIHLVGYSFGSIVALAFAARHPHRIRTIQLCAIPYFESREACLETWTNAPTTNSFLIRYAYIARLFSVVFAPHRKFWAPFLLPFLEAATPMWAITDFMHDKFIPLWRCFQNALVAHRLERGIEVIAKSKIEIQFLHADMDEMAPLCNAKKLQHKLQKLRAASKGDPSSIKLHVYENSYHNFVMLNAEHVAAKISEPMES